jgi:flavodoxin
MNALVIFDSTYGNTEAIARAIAAGLADGFEVRVARAAPGELVGGGAELLVVGGPTQRHGLSPGLEILFEGLPRGALRGRRAAAFDTRYHMSALLSGSAARGAAKRLERAGSTLIAPPESFFMERDRPSSGEKRRHAIERLEPGELERAAAWGRQLAASAGPSQGATTEASDQP